MQINWELFDKHASAEPDENGCIIWKGYIHDSGYGRMGAPARYEEVFAHRLAWIRANGRPIPDGLCVMHLCDVRACVFHGHLRVGTIAENNADMFAKGRGSCVGLRAAIGKAVRGEDHGRAKLTEEEVRKMRVLYADGADSIAGLSARFGVGKSQVQRIVTRAKWRHID